MSQNLDILQPNLRCLNIGTPKNINFPFGTNGKLMVLGVPILKHFSVLFVIYYSNSEPADAMKNCCVFFLHFSLFHSV